MANKYMYMEIVIQYICTCIYMYMYLHLLWGLNFDVSCGIAIHLFKELVEFLVRHNHLHLLLRGAVSMTNDANHTA